MWQRPLMSPYCPVFSFLLLKIESTPGLAGHRVTYVHTAFPRFSCTGHGLWDMNESIVCKVIKNVKFTNVG